MGQKLCDAVHRDRCALTVTPVGMCGGPAKRVLVRKIPVSPSRSLVLQQAAHNPPVSKWKRKRRASLPPASPHYRHRSVTTMQ